MAVLQLLLVGRATDGTACMMARVRSGTHGGTCMGGCKARALLAGERPPVTEADWEAEFRRYQVRAMPQTVASVNSTRMGKATTDASPRIWGMGESGEK
jgi:hypothetical protein